MATNSFDGITNYVWQPTTGYEQLQSNIQAEVDQGLWANQTHIDGWCLIASLPSQGFNNSWVTYTYQSKADNTQTTTVIWPAGWPAPAENINGQLPSHFFTSSAPTTSTTSSSATMSPNVVSVNSIEMLYQVYTAPTAQPTYKIAGEC